jgi:hypothetical protein
MLFDQRQIRRVEPNRVDLAKSRFDCDAAFAQASQALSRYFEERIGHRHDNARDASPHNGIRARRSFAKVATRFERGIERRAKGPVTGGCQRDDLGVRSAELRVPALADNFTVFDDDGSYEGIRFHSPPAALGDFQGTMQKAFIIGHEIGGQ